MSVSSALGEELFSSIVGEGLLCIYCYVFMFQKLGLVSAVLY